jgi:hypothetical protein
MHVSLGPKNIYQLDSMKESVGNHFVTRASSFLV